MKCPQCQFENQQDASFCNECGGKLEIGCPSCGKGNLPGSKFCKGCGHNLRKPEAVPPIDYTQPQAYTPKYLADKILKNRSSIEGERKLVTVLFADVANYTSVAEKLDPEEVHQIMDGCFRILMAEIHRYEGTINQFTGDGVMALFGAPVAHEDHAQRACLAALSIQKTIEGYGDKISGQHGADFNLRIGLNSGPVIVGTIGDDLRMDYTAMGDTTNLASRMETMAAPGTVRVAGNTHRLTRDYFEFKSLGEVAIKGKEKTQQAYELVRPSVVETRIQASVARGLTKFVGRRKQMEALEESFEKARSGAGQIVGIVGEAGIGKSRLLLELRDRLPRQAYTYLEGRCLHFGGAMPYLPILDILKSYFHIKEEHREYLIKQKVRKRLSQLDDKLLCFLPSFQELLSVQVEDEKHLQVAPQQRRQRAFDAIRDLLILESQESPVILAVEDLHWIDKTSRDFLDYLIGWLAKSHILLVLLYRPEYTHTWGSKSYYTHVGLPQMSSDTGAELVQAILEEGEVVRELRKLILGRTSGNPLFVEELTHSLLENGSILRQDNQYLLTRQATTVMVPDTIQGIIAARMDRLEESLKRIMQVASVIGREFAYRLLAATAGTKEALKSSLLNLQDLEFIYEKQLVPELEYIFKHALTQEVAYNSLLSKRRKLLHGQIAGAIEKVYAERLEEHYELLAYHYVSSDNTAKAVEYLDLANRKAEQAHAMEDALAYFEQAMNLMDTLPDTASNRERRLSLLVNQSAVFQLLFRHPEYHELLKRYENLAIDLPDSELAGIFYARLAQCESVFGHYREAVRVGTEAASLCEAEGSLENAGFAYSMVQVACLWSGNLSRTIALKQDVLRMMRKQHNLRFYVYAFVFSAWAKALKGRWKAALKEGQEALRAAEKASDESLISFSGWFLSGVNTLKGDLEQALTLAHRAYESAPTLADKTWTQVAMAWALCHAGEPLKATELLEEILPLFRAGRYVSAILQSMLVLAEACRMTRRYDEAGKLLSEVLETSRRSEARGYLAWAYRVLGEVHLETDLPRAGPAFEQSVALFREIGADNELAKSWAGFGRYLACSGRTTEGREYLSKALATFERLGTLIEPDKVRQELASLPTAG